MPNSCCALLAAEPSYPIPWDAPILPLGVSAGYEILPQWQPLLFERTITGDN